MLWLSGGQQGGCGGAEGPWDLRVTATLRYLQEAGKEREAGKAASGGGGRTLAGPPRDTDEPPELTEVLEMPEHNQPKLGCGGCGKQVPQEPVREPPGESGGMAGGAAEHLAAIKHPETHVSLAEETGSSLHSQLKACGVIKEPQLDNWRAPGGQGLELGQETSGLGSPQLNQKVGLEKRTDSSLRSPITGRGSEKGQAMSPAAGCEGHHC